MGKNLIIKGADFSANGFSYQTPSLLAVLPLTIGVAWRNATLTANPKRSPTLASANNARASQTDYVPIGAYGFGTISLKAKAGYKFAVYFGNTNVPGTADANIVGWGYTTSDNILTLDITGLQYAIIMVASNDDSVLTSTDWTTYIEEL